MTITAIAVAPITPDEIATSAYLAALSLARTVPPVKMPPILVITLASVMLVSPVRTVTFKCLVARV